MDSLKAHVSHGVISFVFAVLFLTAALYYDNINLHEHYEDSLHSAEKKLSAIEARLNARLRLNIKSSFIMQGVFEAKPDLSKTEFQSLASNFFTQALDVKSVAAAPDLILSYLYPTYGNEHLLGLDLSLPPYKPSLLEHAKKNRNIIVDGPVSASKDGGVLIVSAPIFTRKNYTSDTFWGVACTTINLGSLLLNSGILDPDLPFSVSIRAVDEQGNPGIVFHGSPLDFDDFNLEETITLPNGSWQMVATLPKSNVIPKNVKHDRLISLLLGLITTLSLFLYLHLSRKAAIGNLRFKKLIQNTPTPYVINNSKGDITFLNEAFIKTYGYNLEDIPTTNDLWNAAYPDPEYKQHIKAMWRATVASLSSGSSPVPLEVEVATKSGEKRTALMTPEYTESDKGGDHVTVLYDISRRIAYEDELKLASRVFNESSEGIMITDKHKNIIQINPTFSHVTGYSEEEALGATPSILSSGRQSPEFYKQMWQSVKKNGHWQGEVWNKRKNGDLYAELLSISSLLDKNHEVVNYVGQFFDITESKEQQRKLEFMAHYDELTNLPNRVLFLDRFEQAVAHSKRNQSLLAVCFLDLDNFKPVNDNYGHAVGDSLLVDVSKRIKKGLRAEDTISRQGGDEFLLLLGDLDSKRQCMETLDRILTSLSQPYHIDGNKISISASCGVRLHPDEDMDLDLILRHADQAMYHAKISGKNGFHFFDPEEDKQVIEKNRRINEMVSALDNNEFLLYFQPKVNMQTGRVFGMEALIRWQYSDSTLLEPNDFLPYIEGSGLEIKLGTWVLNEAIKQLDEWNSKGLQLEISVNVSSHQLLHKGFIANLHKALNNHPNIAPNFVQLEILESSALSDLAAIGKVIVECRDLLGVNIALDDFGTGYSSLTHLRNLAADTVKIDQSFVHDMINNPEDYTIISGIIGLAKAFNSKLIAEGVETVDQGLMLLAMGCYNAQGYLVSRPIPAEKVLIWIYRYQPIQEWIECSETAKTEQERQLKLVKLSSVQWIKNIELFSKSPSNDMDFYAKNEMHDHYSKWSNKVHHDKLLNQKWIEDLDSAHHDIYQITDKIAQNKGHKDNLLTSRLSEAVNKFKLILKNY